jgi:predicted PurR-regulated permease PerM
VSSARPDPLAATSDTPGLVDRGVLPLLACLMAIAVLGFMVFGPFLVTFAVAASTALLLAPVQARISRALGGRSSVAAAFLVLVCATLLVLLLLTYGAILRAQAAALLESAPFRDPAALQRWWSKTLPALYPRLPPLPWADVLPRLAAAGSHLLREGAMRLGDTLLHLALFFMMLFFLLRDGPLLGAEIRGVSPFSRAQEEDMIRHLSATVRAGMLALVLVPVAEALTAVVGFAIFGLPAPVLWGAMVGFAGLIPVMGTPLAWVPAGLYLLATGPAWRGIGLLLYGVGVIGIVGHIVKPLVLRGGAQIHPLLGFLAILGGIFAFGPAGLIVGPVILSLTMSAVRIYRFDILRWREQPAPIR